MADAEQTPDLNTDAGQKALWDQMQSAHDRGQMHSGEYQVPEPIEGGETDPYDFTNQKYQDYEFEQRVHPAATKNDGETFHDVEKRQHDFMAKALGATAETIAGVIPTDPEEFPLPFDPTGQFEMAFGKGLVKFAQNESEAFRRGPVGEFLDTPLAQPEDFETLENFFQDSFAVGVEKVFPGDDEKAVAIRDFVNARGHAYIQTASGALQLITPEDVKGVGLSTVMDLMLGGAGTIYMKWAGMSRMDMLRFLAKNPRLAKLARVRMATKHSLEKKSAGALGRSIEAERRQQQALDALEIVDPDASADDLAKWGKQMEFDFSGKTDAETIIATARLGRAANTPASLAKLITTRPNEFISTMRELSISQAASVTGKAKRIKAFVAKKLGKKESEITAKDMGAYFSDEKNLLELAQVRFRTTAADFRIPESIAKRRATQQKLASRYLREARGQLAQMGDEGAELARRIDAVDEATTIRAGELNMKIQGLLSGLDDAEKGQLSNLLDPNRQFLNPSSDRVSNKVRRTMTKLKKLIEPLQKDMERIGGDLVDEDGRSVLRFDQESINLFHHSYDVDNPEVRDRILERIIKTAEAKALRDPEFADMETVTQFMAEAKARGLTGDKNPAGNLRVAEALEALQLRQVDQADGILRAHIGQQNVRKSKSLDNSHIFTQTWNIEGDLYNQNVEEVLREMVDSYSRRVEEGRLLGDFTNSNYGNKADILLSRLRSNGHDHRFATDFINQYISGTQPPAGSELRRGPVLRGARALAAITRLSLAQLRNLGQSTNTAAITNIAHTSRAVAEQLSGTADARIMKIADEMIGKSIHDSMIASGIEKVETGYRLGMEAADATLMDKVTRTLNLTMEAGASKLESGAEGVLKWTGFAAAERFNRRVAFNAGFGYAREVSELISINRKTIKGLKKSGENAKLLKSLIEDNERHVRKLEMLGVPRPAIDSLGVKTSKLGEKNLIKAGWKTVKDAQFETTVKDLPLFWSSDYGKLLTQFKSFSFRHMHFMKKHVIDEAKKGNMRPAANWLAMGAALGVTNQSMIDVIRNKDSDDILINQGIKAAKDTHAILAGEKELNLKTAGHAANQWAQFATRTYLGIGSAGIFLEMLTDLFPEAALEQDFRRDVKPAEIAFGPQVGLLADAADAGVRAPIATALNPLLPEGRQLRTTGLRTATRQIPVVGPAISAGFFRSKRKGPGEGVLNSAFRRLFRQEE